MSHSRKPRPEKSSPADASGHGPKRRPGPPSIRTPEIEDKILTRIAMGESLKQICEDEQMPSRETVRLWAASDLAFSEGLSRARIEQADAMDEKIVEIMGKVEAGTLTPEQGRVLIWAAQWRASKLRPDRYGDKLQAQVEHSGTVEHVLTEERRMKLIELRKSAVAFVETQKAQQLAGIAREGL